MNRSIQWPSGADELKPITKEHDTEWLTLVKDLLLSILTSKISLSDV